MITARKTVWVMGAYGNGNIGDDMLGDVVRQTLEARGLRPQTFAGEFFPFRRAASHGRKSVARQVKRGDLLLIAGGGLLNDHFGYGFLKLFAFVVIVCRLRGAKVAFSGIGVEGFNSRRGRILARLAVMAANHVSVRDKPSAENLASVGRKARIIPDLGWLARRHLPLAEESKPRDTVVLSIAVEDEAKRKLRETAVREAAAAVLRASSSRVVLVAMQSSSVEALDDEISLNRIRDSLGSERVSVYRPKSYVDLYPVLLRASVVAGYRLHAAVLGVVAGCRVVSISRSHKVREALREFPQCRVLDEFGTDTPNSALADAVMQAMSGDIPAAPTDLSLVDKQCRLVEADILEAVEEVR